LEKVFWWSFDLAAQEPLELCNLEGAMEVQLISGTFALETTFLQSAMVTRSTLHKQGISRPMLSIPAALLCNVEVATFQTNQERASKHVCVHTYLYSSPSQLKAAVELI
jgi:hypothetical protein